MRYAAFVLCVAMAIAGCERETRTLVQSAEVSVAITSASASKAAAQGERMDRNAYALAEGKRLFDWYNCSGCHAYGGGDKGPALMDGAWIYGSDPMAVFTSIVEGRPNGMPAFGGRIAEYEVWQIAAYVRSMAGLARWDAAPGRNDTMQTKPPEQRMEPQRSTAAERTT
jgi:cytochrome c oxidase cbb3-type subunit III